MASKYYHSNRPNQLKRQTLKDQSGWIISHLYAAFVCELWEMGWSAEQIEELFAKTQTRWEDSTINKWDIVKNVKEVTGVDVEYIRKGG